MTAKTYVLIETEIANTRAVITALNKLDEVKSVHAVTGPYDIIAYLEADDPQVIGDLILNKIRPLPGMKNTLTCVVFD